MRIKNNKVLKLTLDYPHIKKENPLYRKKSKREKEKRKKREKSRRNK
jgi:hypothetical protein